MRIDSLLCFFLEKGFCWPNIWNDTILQKKKKGFLHDFSFQNNSFNYNGKKFSGNLINYDQLTTITKKKNLTMLHIWWDDLWHFFKMIVAVNLFDLFEPNCNSLSKICFLQLFPDTKRKKKKKNHEDIIIQKHISTNPDVSPIWCLTLLL